jgi:hypothetical protein
MFKVPQYPLTTAGSVNPRCTNLIRYRINCGKDRGRGKSINNKPKNIQWAHWFVSMQFGEMERGVQIGRINASRDGGSPEYLHCCIKKLMEIYKYIWKSETVFSFWKVKVHPRTGHEGPEVEQTYSSTLSLTSALDWCGQRHAPVALPTGKRAGTHCIGRRVSSRAGMNWGWKSRPPPPPTGIRPTDCPAHWESIYRMSYPSSQPFKSKCYFS